MTVVPLPKVAICVSSLLALLLWASTDCVRAQSISLYLGAGTATDSAAKTGAAAACPSGNFLDQETGQCEPAPTIGGWFGAFGGDVMFTPHVGMNGEYAFRFGQALFLPGAHLNYRPSFYDFNAVWDPVSGKRIVLALEGGGGGARLTFYSTQLTNSAGMGVPENAVYGSSNHFQVHGGAGTKFYVHRNIFVEPRVDLHYVVHLSRQFGRSVVPQYTLLVGHTWGQR